MKIHHRLLPFQLLTSALGVDAFLSFSTPRSCQLPTYQPSTFVTLSDEVGGCRTLFSNRKKDFRQAFVSSQSPSFTSKLNMVAEQYDDWSDAAESLPLSDYDRSVLEAMKSRHVQMPIMILDSMLPGQCLEFGSADPKFLKLITHVLTDGNEEIGMIGLNPHTGKPLNLGVTLPVTKDTVKINPITGMATISVQGKRRFEVQGEPWMDKSKSFYMADLEIVDDRTESITDEEKREAKSLSSTVPGLVEKWLDQVLRSGKSDVGGMKERMDDIGPMPDNIGDRAIWVAALLNPIPALGVCLEIRPAMLACKNDFQRMKLATAAIQSSIDHLSGRRRLF